jgi:protoheme IX farnesyltransferase
VGASHDVLSSSPTHRVMSRVVADLFRLFKLHVVALLLLAAVTGAFLGSGQWPGTDALLVLALTGGLAAAGSSALNQYLEQETDSQMARTWDRPLVTGGIGRSVWIPLVGASLVVIPTTLVLPHNPALALWVALGAIVYLGVYTIWLKPRTPLNVVIGGVAGSCAVLSGGAAVGAWTDPGVLGLALLLFFWSPTHFWSLALACQEDYARVRVPMLPVVTTRRRAASWSLAHSVASGVIALALAFHPMLGIFYLLPALMATLYLLLQSYRLVRCPSERRAWRLFHTSNFYLGLLLLTICLVTLFR